MMIGQPRPQVDIDWQELARQFDDLDSETRRLIELCIEQNVIEYQWLRRNPPPKNAERREAVRKAAKSAHHLAQFLTDHEERFAQYQDDPDIDWIQILRGFYLFAAVCSEEASIDEKSRRGDNLKLAIALGRRMNSLNVLTHGRLKRALRIAFNAIPRDESEEVPSEEYIDNLATKAMKDLTTT